jgi:hypothetical protein
VVSQIGRLFSGALLFAFGNVPSGQVTHSTSAHVFGLFVCAYSVCRAVFPAQTVPDQPRYDPTALFRWSSRVTDMFVAVRSFVLAAFHKNFDLVMAQVHMIESQLPKSWREAEKPKGTAPLDRAPTVRGGLDLASSIANSVRAGKKDK